MFCFVHLFVGCVPYRSLIFRIVLFCRRVTYLSESNESIISFVAVVVCFSFFLSFCCFAKVGELADACTYTVVFLFVHGTVHASAGRGFG